MKKNLDKVKNCQVNSFAEGKNKTCISLNWVYMVGLLYNPSHSKKYREGRLPVTGSAIPGTVSIYYVIKNERIQC